MAGKIYVANTSGETRLKDGTMVLLHAGVTRVREGHPLLEGREALFDELKIHHDLEDARSAPEEKKPVPVAEPEPKAEPEPEKKPAGLTSKDAPGTPQRRGRQRVTKTGE
jgi:hypothetical protein